MFGDGKVQVITHEGDLYINMWELTSHLLQSAEMLEQNAGSSEVSNTMRVLVWTLCDLAMYELGMEQLDEIDNVDTLTALWSRHRE
jgi:hypothetical protein